MAISRGSFTSDWFWHWRNFHYLVLIWRLEKKIRQRRIEVKNSSKFDLITNIFYIFLPWWKLTFMLCLQRCFALGSASVSGTELRFPFLPFKPFKAEPFSIIWSFLLEDDISWSDWECDGCCFWIDSFNNQTELMFKIAQLEQY